MTSQKEIAKILSVVQNPVRRKLIKRLSQEPSYPLELSKELGMGQQLVAAHLDIMEKNGFLGSLVKTSPVGPSRKVYFLKKSAYLSVSFGPHLYNEQVVTLDTLPSEISEDAERLMARIESIEEIENSPRMVSFSDLMAEIDAKINDFEAEKAVLLYIRNLAMKQASEAMHKTDKTHDERRVLYYLLDVRNQNVEDIAAALNLREAVVRNILSCLGEELPEE